MEDRSLFQLGMDLDAGTTQKEDHADAAVKARNANAHAADVQGGVHAETRQQELERSSTPEKRSTQVPRHHDESDTRLDHFVRRDGEVFAGTHLIVELAEADGLDDPARIEQAFLDAIDAAGATLLHIHLHRFTPQGVSGVAVLAESHISVHTWPESRYGAFDVFMCGDADPHAAVEVLRRAFNAGRVEVQEIRRGAGFVG